MVIPRYPGRCVASPQNSVISCLALGFRNGLGADSICPTTDARTMYCHFDYVLLRDRLVKPCQVLIGFAGNSGVLSLLSF